MTVHTEETRHAVLTALVEGSSHQKISNTFGVPMRTVERWQQQDRLTKTPESIKQTRIAACVDVIKLANDIRSSMGSSPALDYGQHTGGQGAQFLRSDRSHQLIDYTVDVDRAAADTLSPFQYAFYKERMCNEEDEFDNANRSEAILALQEQLGQVFIERELWPSKRYFTVVKK